MLSTRCLPLSWRQGGKLSAECVSRKGDESSSVRCPLSLLPRSLNLYNGTAKFKESETGYGSPWVVKTFDPSLWTLSLERKDAHTETTQKCDRPT